MLENQIGFVCSVEKNPKLQVYLQKFTYVSQGLDCNKSL